MRTKAIVVAGAGHHARRIYIPELIRSDGVSDHKIILVDLLQANSQIQAYVLKNGYEHRVDSFFIGANDQGKPFAETELAKKLIENYDISAIIVSTEPTSHLQYIHWALFNDIHILTDKPISTHDNIVNDPQLAEQLQIDYQGVMKLYNDSRALLCLSTQRRFETSYTFASDLIKEVKDKFNMPITSIQAYHSDGVWIFPDEILTQRTHPYNTGYGKLSHSGFHILDAVWQFYESGTSEVKKADSMDTYATALFPNGLLKNFDSKDYRNAFGANVVKHEEKYYQAQMENFGEVDVFGNINLLSDDTPVATFSINLLHNGFSKRSWPEASNDLYKGNGRVKHQYYNIQQGPFQCIQIHNYQATDDHDSENTGDSYALGGKNHFDIYVFRNSKMFGASEPSLRSFSSKDLDEMYSSSNSKLSNELAKSVMISEFIDNVLKIRFGAETRDSVEKGNCITSYEMPVKIMSALYKSLGNQKNNEPAVISSRVKHIPNCKAEQGAVKSSLKSSPDKVKRANRK